MPSDPNKEWCVYVVQSLEKRFNARGKALPGFHYVGCTTDVARRLQEHNGLHPSGKPGNKRGSIYTSNHRPWRLVACHGPYWGQSEALKAERALKKGKRGVARTQWTTADSPWCRGLGSADPRIDVINENLRLLILKRSPASSTEPEGNP